MARLKISNNVVLYGIQELAPICQSKEQLRVLALSGTAVLWTDIDLRVFEDPVER